MTAMSSGGRPAGIPNPLSSASEQPHADQSRHRDGSQPRALDQIFPMQGDANRSREMQAAWRSFCRDRLAHYKCPSTVEVLPDLPKNALGKILKSDLRATLWKGRTRAVN